MSTIRYFNESTFEKPSDKYFVRWLMKMGKYQDIKAEDFNQRRKANLKGNKASKLRKKSLEINGMTQEQENLTT